MLNVMRENLGHLKWVLWIVAFSMVAYLGAFFSCRDDDPTSDLWAAKVGPIKISTHEFLELARRQDDTYRRMLGAQYEQLRKQIRIGSQTIQALVDRTIMLEEAKALGLSANPADIADRISQEPSFKDASGQFIGRDRYIELVSLNVPGGVAAFEQQLGDDITIQKWIDLVTEAASVSDEELERLYRERNEKAAIDYVFVAAGAQTVDPNVSEADVDAWYASHQDDYRRGEARKIRMIVVERQPQMAKAEIGDDEIRAFYESNTADFARPEQRRASHILFRVDPAASAEDKRSIHDLAQSVLDRLKGGEDMATLARTLSQDPGSAEKGGDLGFFGRGQMVGPFEEAVFSTEVGALAAVVETQFGFHVIKVTDSRPGGTAPLEEVSDAIRRTLQVRRAQELVQAEAAKIRAAITGPADFETAASQAGLKVEDRVVTREDPARELGASPEFIEAVFSMPVEQVSAPLPLARGLAVVALLETMPPGVRPLDEVRAKVKSDILSDRSRQAALAAARRALAGGDSLEGAARRLGAQVQSSGDLTSGFVLPGPGRSPELEAVVFSQDARVGTTGVQATPGGAVIYEITRHDVYDPARFEAQKVGLRQEILGQRRNTLLEGIMQNIRTKYAVQINERIVEQANG